MTEKPKERDPKSGKLLPKHCLNQEHGGWVWLRHGKCPSVRGRRRIMRELSELRRRLMETVPGSEDVRKQILINQVVSAQGFVLLLESFLKRFGILDPKSFQQGQVQTQGSMVMIVSLLNVQARAVASLGMDSKEGQEILDLGKYIDMKDKEKAAKEEGPKS